MTINTWIERLLAEIKDEKIMERFELGQKVYSELQSYKNKINTDEYDKLMQKKHDYVYERISTIE